MIQHGHNTGMLLWFGFVETRGRRREGEGRVREREGGEARVREREGGRGREGEARGRERGGGRGSVVKWWWWWCVCGSR